MNVTEFIARLLRHFSPEERSIPSSVDYPGRAEEALDALNSAYAELITLGPTYQRQEARGKLLRAPFTMTGVTFTEGSDTATVADAEYQSWMTGCTAKPEATEIDNEILESSSSGGTTTIKLRYPYDGSTGSKSLQVWNDTITLDPDEERVVEPVTILNRRHLTQVKSAEQIGLQRPEFDYGSYKRRSISSAPVKRATAATPEIFWFEHHTPIASDTTAPLRRMKVWPLPPEDLTLSYHAKLSPPFYEDPESTDDLPLPAAVVIGVLLPIAEFHLSTCPFFRTGIADTQIQANYQLARTKAEELQPATRSGFQMRPPF
jgi:hypothetical protein